MLASFPASMVNQKAADFGIQNRFNTKSFRFSSKHCLDRGPHVSGDFEHTNSVSQRHHSIEETECHARSTHIGGRGTDKAFACGSEQCTHAYLNRRGEPVAAVTNGSRCAGPIQKRFNSDITVSATLCSTWLPTGCDAMPNEVISNGKLARKLKPLLKGGLPLR